jgi:hypothetical protein
MSNDTADMQEKLRVAEAKAGVAESSMKLAQSGLTRNRTWSALIGAGIVIVAGHWFPGYQLDSTAENTSASAAQSAVGDVMAQLCVERFMAGDGLDARLEALNDAVGDWSQANHIRDGNWATKPDGKQSDHDTAKKCRSLIAERVTAEEAKTAS